MCVASLTMDFGHLPWFPWLSMNDGSRLTLLLITL